MKHKHLAILTSGVLMLGGCASMNSPELESTLSATQGDNPNFDKRYVATVQHLAQQRGTRVIWVNPPENREKRVDDL